MPKQMGIPSMAMTMTGMMTTGLPGGRGDVRAFTKVISKSI